ncbi:MAG: (5-formylfuran-3-yl)methyl phosphate synthase [Candidatus Nezhaarchaeota archaeon]|nr:(5-formylfuran-3-yl)methyl phosphate synthase [Candidatus Nezhaarchaeota archaeon]
MKLLISVQDVEEAREALLGGADVIDVKRPSEGSLGACPPKVIREVRRALPSSVEVSAAIGDFPDLPGSASLAALGAIVAGVDYVKVGVYGPRTLDSALKLLSEVKEAVYEVSSEARVVAAGYADYARVGCLSPWEVLEAARKADVDVWMVDTKVKDGLSLLSFLDPGSLGRLIDEAHDYGLWAAIAGSLNLNHLNLVKGLKADVIGFRSAACLGDRVGGRVKRELVMEIKRRLSL